jgi:hypothetical protein
MTTYRVIDVEHNSKGAISNLVVKEDTGTKLKKKRTYGRNTVLQWINDYGDVFYKIDLATGKTGRVRKDPKSLSTIGDDDLVDNLD